MRQDNRAHWAAARGGTRLAGGLGYQWAAGDGFKDPVGRRVLSDERLWRNEEGLFEGVLAGQGGVCHAIGVDDPGPKRREFQSSFRAGRLEHVIFLQVILEWKHERVIRRGGR